MKRYEIWLANIPTVERSHVQHGFRPVLIVSNDKANVHSPVITAVPLTTKLNKNRLPTHVLLQEQGLEQSSLALCEQIMTLDKSCLIRRVGFVYKHFDCLAIQHALSVQLGMVA